MTFRQIILSVLVFIPLHGISQTNSFKLSGQLISINSGQPLSHFYIKLSPGEIVLSDSLGYFEFSNVKSGIYKLIAQKDYDKCDSTITITNDITNFRLYFFSKCYKYNKDKALKDIKENKYLLLLQGGISPIIYLNDSISQIKYGFKFFDFGDIVSESPDCIKEYNQIIIAFLDKTYGKKWRKEIRKDVIGL